MQTAAAASPSLRCRAIFNPWRGPLQEMQLRAVGVVCMRARAWCSTAAVTWLHGFEPRFPHQFLHMTRSCPHNFAAAACAVRQQGAFKNDDLAQGLCGSLSKRAIAAILHSSPRAKCKAVREGKDGSLAQKDRIQISIGFNKIYIYIYLKKWRGKHQLSHSYIILMSR